MNAIARRGVFTALVSSVVLVGLWSAASEAQTAPAATAPGAAARGAGGPGRGRGGDGPNLNEADHQLMMKQLGLTALRPGKDGNNKNAPNYANYDESKANPYPNLPDPLTLKNGQKVTTADMWWKERRPEIVEDFDREVYGRVPKDLPKVTWEVTATTNGMNGEFPIITKTLVGHVDNASFPAIKVDIGLSLTVPANAVGPVPVMMVFSGGGLAGAARGGDAGVRGVAAARVRRAALRQRRPRQEELALPTRFRNSLSRLHLHQARCLGDAGRDAAARAGPADLAGEEHRGNKRHSPKAGDMPR